MYITNQHWLLRTFYLFQLHTGVVVCCCVKYFHDERQFLRTHSIFIPGTRQCQWKLSSKYHDHLYSL